MTEGPDPLHGDFRRDTDIEPDGEVPGRYHLDLSPAWNIFYAFGGMTMAVALRGIERELAQPDLVPLTANALFVSPVTAGPVEIDVDILRRGRAAAQGVANLRNRGLDGTALHVTAAFGRPAPSEWDYVDIEFPDVPMPDRCPRSPRMPEGSPFRDLNFHHQIDWRPTALPDRDNWVPGPAVSASWARFVREPRRPDGSYDPIALCLPADSIGGAIGNHLGVQEILVLSLEIGVQFFRPPTSTWILQHSKAPVVEDGFVSASVDLWDADRNLVAVSTQRAKLRPLAADDLPGPPAS